MNNKEKVNIFWFRRDLRLDDNRGLTEALQSDYPVLPLFIIDTEITDELVDDDPRVNFIFQLLEEINIELRVYSSGILCKKGRVISVWKEILDMVDVQQVFCNEDYEPYAIERDENVRNLLLAHNIPLFSFKDQVIFSKDEVVKNDQTPYTVYTPYKNKWLSLLKGLSDAGTVYPSGNYAKLENKTLKLQDFGFRISSNCIKPYSITNLDDYKLTRDFPARDQTSNLGVYLRFGAISIRKLIAQVINNSVFLSELIWREFFMQILYHFPQVVDHNFKRKYDAISWRNKQDEFEKWRNGETGYPFVDAGMRELNLTGYMHNRVRMVSAGFLCKHLLIDWRWGEAYFAEKLMDYELASNNGNWQWAAGTGCDAAPYFRVFNPTEQAKKFDPEGDYIRKWIPELMSSKYPKPIVEHKIARERAIQAYKSGLLNRK